ncbi:E3 ubiquitin-protein ligase SINA-like 10 [Lolium rigidum]|uniref:E3 ubiquitin-protein ligase SINA-like 10 n=1 Tax=Lolium rigidum TaxID=89674 RepID=UPI001F5D144C|nr:E3 ubiquitin-protein ligase SINA-like 10 [Lolium rigidum]
MRIDPDLLDCSICFEPLCPPLYQCQNGHVACISCWSRLNNKCHVCSNNAIFTRNIALEKIVESVKSSCAYAKWGCCNLVSYAQRSTHEEACLFAPSTCPIPGCGYRGFTGCWSGHFLVDHSADFLHFVYDQPFEVNLEVSLPFLVLLGEDDHLFLLLNKNMMPFGYAFTVVCLRTGNLNWKFSYGIKAASKGNSENCLQLKASVKNTKDWGGVHPAEAFLLVPYDFCGSASLTLDVSVARSSCV